MNRREKRNAELELKKLQHNVRIDWIKDIDTGNLQDALEKAAKARAPIHLIAKIYAAAIVRHGLDGFDWVRAGSEIKARYLYLPDPVEKVKSEAWKVIARAKARQQIAATKSPVLFALALSAKARAFRFIFWGVVLSVLLGASWGLVWLLLKWAGAI